MSTVLTNGIIIPENGSRNWGGDLANNWNIIDVNVGYMTDVKNRVTTLENSVAENTANIQTNASNISALQTSKQDVIDDLETIRTGASAGATAVQPSGLNNYYTKAEVETELASKANASDLRNYLPLIGGAITGNITNNSNVDGWMSGLEWLYNNKRFAYIHPFLDNAKGEKSLFIQADTQIILASNDLSFNDCRVSNKSIYCPDNHCDLGTATNRFKDIYATNATINTSDRNAKTCIENIDDKLLTAWGKVSLVSFKFKDAVKKKGDNARKHTGYIAQNIQEELDKYGIDAFEYGLFCYNSWNAQKEKSHEEESTDEEGNTKTVKVIDTPAREAGATYGLRYIECLVVECAYLRKKNKELDDRITKLEENLKTIA